MIFDSFFLDLQVIFHDIQKLENLENFSCDSPAISITSGKFKEILAKLNRTYMHLADILSKFK